MYLEKFRLTDRHALVTGGGQGIGLACAEALAEAGAKVWSPTDMPVAEEGQAELKDRGHAVGIVKLDVTKSNAGRRGRGQVSSELGRAYSGQQCRRGEERRARRGHHRRALALLTWTSISTACSGAAAPSAGRCWRRAAARSSISARCRAYRQQAAAAGVLQCLQGRGAPSDQVARLPSGRPRCAGQRGRAHLHRDAADQFGIEETRRCTGPGSR